ncbi:MAG: D-cysteine desulfhydrase family protein [Calditrichaeota bacterium]|nr:D-cysteine desulfhydrase family protein [Calditrichota bacterium]
MGKNFIPGKMSLARLPTPIQKLERLTKKWNSPEIYIKRDDFTGSEYSGNKIRKLEFSIAEAKRQSANFLITCGGVQSNHARATAVAAARLGMGSFLVLRGEEPEEKDGNLFLDLLVGARVRYISAEDYRNRVEEIMGEIGDELAAEGHKAYIVPEGASNAIGSFGYFTAAAEILQQMNEMGINFDYIVCADGSGGTHAGLLMGKKFFQLSSEIIGINVCDDADYFKEKVTRICRNAAMQYRVPVTVEAEEVHVIDGYVGEGYALNRPEEIEFISQIAKLEGVILDPVYTGKAFFGVYDQIQKGFFKKEDKILFIHTGGIFGLFPKKNLFGPLKS